MANKLRALKLERIDLVDEPANIKSRVVLVKRADVTKEQPSTGQVHVNRPDWLAKEAAYLAEKRALFDKEHPVTKTSFIAKLAALFKSAGPLQDWASQEEGEPEQKEGEAEGVASALKAHADKLGEAIAAYGDGAGLAADHPYHKLKALHAELCNKLAEAESTKEAARKAAEGEGEAEADADAEGRVQKMRVDLEKQIVDLRKKAEAAEQRAIEAEKIAKAERDARDLEGEKTTLRKFRHVTIDIDKDAPMFQKLRMSDKALYDATMAKLSAAEEVAKKSEALERELGSDAHGAASGSAWAAIEAEADKVIAKGEKGMTREKAIDYVMKHRTDLVRAYKAEESGQIS